MSRINSNFLKNVIIHQSFSLCSFKKRLIWVIWVMFETNLSSTRRNLTSFVKITMRILCNLTKLIFTKFKVDASMSMSIVIFCISCCVWILSSKINWRSLMSMFMTFKWQNDNLTMTRYESIACFNWWILLRISFRSFWVRLSSKTFSFSNNIEFFREFNFQSNFSRRLHLKQCSSSSILWSLLFCLLSIYVCKMQRLR